MGGFRYAALALGALFMLVTGAPATAQPVEAELPIVNVYGRDRTELSGQWRYIVDPMRMGFRDGRIRSFHRDLQPENQELIEYDWSASPTLSVPGDWTSQVEELRWYEGLVWHHRVFDAPPQPGKRSFLHFEAVNYHAHVYLNGEKVGEHVGGFTPFSIEVTGKLKPEGNVLVVGADSEHDAESVPATQVDWWNYGGITRPVHLVHVPAAFARHYAVRLTRDGRIAAAVRLDGARAGQAVTVSIPELGVTLNGRTDANGEMEAATAAPAALQRWSPSTPKLYDVTIRAGEDSLQDRIGFRTVEVDGTRILLNGEPIFFRGISIHEEAIGPVATRAMSEAAAHALLSEAKALGGNFVRLSHYPHSEMMTRVADEIGLMVWSEIPVYWDMAFADPETLKVARSMLAESMTRDMNRASVVIWSVGNETPETPERLVFMRRLIDDVRERDPDRLVSAALHDDSDASTGYGSVVTVDDPIGEYIDVLAMNRYEAWYGDRTPAEIDEVQWRSPYDKPLIFSEFGADALFGYRADRTERWSEDYQRWLYEETLEMAERIPNLAGVSPWILKDFRSPRRFHGIYQQYWNRKGLISPTGQRKLAWETLRDWYAEKAAADGQ